MANVIYSDENGNVDWNEIRRSQDQDNFNQYKKNAEQEDMQAQYKLAENYLCETGVEQNFHEAINWYEKAPTRNYQKTDNLAASYLQQKYSAKAVELLERTIQHANENKEIELQKKLPERIERKKNEYLNLSKIYPEKQLFPSLKKAIEQECNTAENEIQKETEYYLAPIRIRLAECYKQALGVQQNLSKAIEQLRIAADNQRGGNNRLAQRKLAIHFFFQDNYEEACNYFDMAIRDIYSLEEYGQSEAELGIFYYYRSKLDQAIEYFINSAIQKNNTVGVLWLAYVYKKHPEKTIELLKSQKNNYHRSSDMYSDLINLSSFDNLRGLITDYLLHKTAARFFLKDDDDDDFHDLDILNYAFPVEIIHFLENQESSPAHIILAFYYQRQEEKEKYLAYLEKASQKDMLGKYLLGKYYKNIKNVGKAKTLFEELGKYEIKYRPEINKNQPYLDRYDLTTQEFIVYLAHKEIKDIKHQEEIEEKNQQLQEKEKDLEDMMSMFAHKFRSPLDAIIYNTSHDNNPKLYAEAAQTMRGLLDIFSIISTDEKILTEKIKADYQGNARLNTVFSKTLNMILLHLLSASGTEKIHQHYLAYAKAHGKIAASVTDKEWYDEHFELEQALQAEWEQDFAALLSQSLPLTERLAWLEQHFFKLELIGFDRDDIQFKEYAITESLLTILLNEILVNAFKYYSSETRQAVVLEWSERDGKQILSCRNPSIRRERTTIKGSGKGHTFLSALARKIGGQFSKPKPQDDFVLEFGILNELLISES